MYHPVYLFMAQLLADQVPYACASASRAISFHLSAESALSGMTRASPKRLVRLHRAQVMTLGWGGLRRWQARHSRIERLWPFPVRSTVTSHSKPWKPVGRRPVLHELRRSRQRRSRLLARMGHTAQRAQTTLSIALSSKMREALAAKAMEIGRSAWPGVGTPTKSCL